MLTFAITFELEIILISGKLELYLSIGRVYFGMWFEGIQSMGQGWDGSLRQLLMCIYGLEEKINAGALITLKY